MAISTTGASGLVRALRKLEHPGHFCQIYDSAEKALDVALTFVRVGLARGMSGLYLADEHSVRKITDAAGAAGIDIDSDELTILEARVFFDNSFRIDCALKDLRERLQAGKAAGGLYVVNEMTWALDAGRDRPSLADYEARLDRLLPDLDLSMLCLYNRDRFDPECIRDALRSHSVVVYDDRVCPNIYYEGAKEDRSAHKVVERLLGNLRELSGQESRAGAFEVAPDAMFLIDAEGRCIDVNPAACRLFGYTRQEFLDAGECLLSFLGYADNGVIDGKDESHRQQGDFLLRQPLHGKDGSTIWAKMSITPLDTDGQPLVLGVLRDVTAHRQAEQALQDREFQFRQIIDLVPHAIFVKDLKGRFLLVNRALADAYDTSVDELTGSLQADHHPSEEQVRRFEREDREVITSGQPLRISEKDILHTNGDTHLYEVIKVPFEFAGAEDPVVMGIAVDITERKRAENALFRLLELSRTLLIDRDPDIILRRAIKAAVDIVEIADRGSIQLLAEDGETMHTVVTSAGDLKSYTAIFRPGVGIAGHALEKQMVINVSDVEQDDRFVKGKLPLRFRSLMVVPLATKERLLGTLSLSCKKANAFGPAEEALSELIAEQVAAVLENVRLLNEWCHSEQRMRDFLDNVDDMVYFQSLDGSYSYGLNAASTHITGYSVEEFAENPNLWRELLHPESLRVANEFFATNPEGVASFETEYRLRRKDGEWRWVQSRMTGVKDVSGKYIGYNCIDRDITDRKRAEEAVHQRQRELESLIEINRDLSGTLDLDELLELITGQAVSLLDAEGCLLFRLESDDTLRPVVALGSYAPRAMEQVFEVGQGLTGHCVQERRPILANDAHRDPRFVVMSAIPPYAQEHIMVAPLIFGDRPTGAMLVNRVNKQPFTEDQLALFAGLAQQAAIAIENARLFEESAQRASQLAMLNEIGQAVSSLHDRESLFELIYRLLQHVLSLDAFYICLYDEESGIVTFPLVYDGGKRFEQTPLEIDLDTTLGQTILTTKPRLINRRSDEISQRPHYPVGDPKQCASSLMFAPLLAGTRIVGALSAQSYDTSQRYRDDHLDLLVGVANQAAIAIENARLFTESRQRATQLAMLNEIGRAVSSLRDPDSLFELIYKQLKDPLELDAFEICLYDAQSDIVSYPLVYEAGQRYKEPPSSLPAGSIIETSLLSGEPSMVNRTAEELEKLPLHPIGDKDQPSASMLFAPLKTGDRVIGLLGVHSYRLNAYDGEQLELLVGVANQVANAIENARLFEQTQIALAEVRAAEERFRDVALSTSDYVWELDADRYYIYCSERIFDVVGYMVDEVLGQPYDMFLSPEDRTELSQLLAQAEPLVDLEICAQHKAGHPVWLLVNAVPVFDAGDELAGYRGVAKDITAQRETEAALIQERKLLRTLIDTVPELVYVKDTESRFVLLNREALRVFGLDNPDDVVGKTDFDFHPEELAGRYYADEQPVISDGRSLINREEPLIDSEGERRWLLTTKVPLRDSSGAIIGLIGVGRDITEQKVHAEERERLLATLQQRTMQLQTAAEVSSAASSTLALDTLQQTVVDLIRERFDLYYVGLFLVDQDGAWTGATGDWLMLRAGTGEAGADMLAEGHKLHVDGESMVGRCVIDGEACITLNVDREPARFKNPYLPLTRSEMALPLSTRSRVIGALSIQSVDEDAFSDIDVAVLQTMASQVANAIENARLFEQARRRAGQLSLLNDIGHKISSLLNPESMLEVIYQQIQRALPLDAFFVGLYDEEQKQISYPLVYDEGFRYSESPRKLPTYTLTTEVFRTGKPQLLHRTVEEIEALDLEYMMGSGRPSASLLYVPLLLGDRVTGVLSVQSYEFNAYTQDHLSMVVGVANQAAIAIENARLYAEIQQHVETLDRRVEARTAELREALIRAQRSERAKADFVSTVNHELRTPLANLKLYLGLLRKGKPEKQTYYMDTLEREIERLANLVEDILAIARLESDAPVRWEKVDLVTIAQDAAHRFLPLADSREIRFAYAMPETRVIINADAGQIMRIFINLLGNALTYTPPGGSVMLAIRTRQANDGRWAVISVQDNGPGIPLEEQNKIFERFYRGDVGRESGLPGSGLGLSIVREIAHLHNGRVELDSVPGEGSIFNVWLPLA